MNDTQKPTAEQQKENIIKALVIAGFEENIEFQGVYARESNEIRCIVDMTAGISAYLYDIINRCKINEDSAGILAGVMKMIDEAKDGQMPAQTEPDMQYSKEAAPDHMPESNEPEFSPPEPAQDSTPTEIVRSTAPPAPYEPQGMMIQGLTPGLKEIGKIKIGRKGAVKKSKSGNEYRPPEKFDHFEVVTLYKDDAGDFIPDMAIMGLIGDNAKELDITLLYNDPTLNFFTRYNQYKGGKCMCSGDGIDAVQADGTKIKCNPDTCTIFKTKHCKPNGILSVILKDAPSLGGVYKFRTTSYNSIRSILSSMFFLQSLTGGILANIPLKMTVSPMSVNPIGSPTAQTIYVVNLIYPGNVDDLHKQTIEIMTHQAGMQSKIVELEAKARVAITAPETKEEIQDVEAEFYPDNAKEIST